MTFDLVAIIDGVEQSLTDGNLCYLLGDDGLGMAPLHDLSERGPLQDGDTERGERLDARIFRLFLEIVGADYGDLFYRRHALITALKRSPAPIKFRWDFQAGARPAFSRQIDAKYVGDMSMPSADRHPFSQTVVASFKAGDPTFYDPAAQTLTFTLGGGGGSFVVPVPVPTAVGASTIDAYAAVNYAGSARTYPVIRVTGPITNPIIENETTGDVLDFTGIIIASGNYYEIDLRYGAKTVVDQTGANKLSDLTDDSDLATWRIAEAPTAPGGINSIHVSGSGADANSKIDITWLVRYIGL